MEDNQLAAEAAQGDGRAMSALVERYRAYIYTIAYKIALHEDNALDITQNVFVRLMEKIGGFNGSGPFRAWLAAVTVNEAMTYLRRSGRRETAMAPEDLDRLMDERPPDSAGQMREALNTADRKQLVECAMADLSPQQRAIFTLRFREDLGPNEIAGRLDLAPGHVRTQLHRAIARIREKLKTQVR